VWTAEPNVGRMVSWLLAGIVFVGLAGGVDAPRPLGFVFIALFLAALFLAAHRAGDVAARDG